MSAHEPIRVWRFDHAPEGFRLLSTHGGDEDWIAHVPASIADMYIPWLESGTRFGCCETSEHKQPDGSVVYIGAHA